MNQKRIKILVACHKPDKVYHDNIYMPIHVGKAISRFNLSFLGDDTGDNISEKNPNYCELTALYWAWKNLKDIDYIGLCHYRRYFDFHNQSFCHRNSFEPSDKIGNHDYSLTPKIIKILESGKIIVPKKNVGRCSVLTEYCMSHISDDMRTLRRIVMALPDKRYAKAFNKVMNGNKYSACNMFVMPWNVFSNYCQWLFDVLFAVERQTDTTNYSSRQKRIYGFMSERLLDVFLYANDLKEHEVPVITFSDDKVNLNMPWWEYVMKTFIKNLAFKFTLPPLLLENQ